MPTVKKTEPDETPTEPADPPTAMETAAAEARNDDVIVKFRGAEFTITRVTLASYLFLMAIESNRANRTLWALLGPVDEARFAQLVERDESMETVAFEFFDALGQEIGSGNS